MEGATYRARNPDTGVVFADQLRAAHTHWTRLKGLLGTRSLEQGEGLWLKPCNQVHMIGMRYAVDLAFLDDANRVVRTVNGLRPGRLSPRVREATSVLELPAGTLARAGLPDGTRLDIEGNGRSSEAAMSRAIARVACNLALAALYALFAAAHWSFARRTGHWSAVAPIVVQEVMLVVLFVTRRASIATSHRPVDWAAGALGTFLPLVLRATEGTGAWCWLGQPLQILGVTFATVAVAFLGRSVGVVAANRGIKTVGLYRVVRHPMYASYVVSYLGYLGCYPSPANAVIVGATLVAMNVRALAEERLLAKDEAYRDYLRRTRWRFIPYLY